MIRLHRGNVHLHHAVGMIRLVAGILRLVVEIVRRGVRIRIQRIVGGAGVEAWIVGISYVFFIKEVFS
jgi:hypothetical protein